MPVIPSSFEPATGFKNQHWSTIFPNFFKIGKANYDRIRLTTPDNDFFDIDTHLQGSNNLIIALHGLEGSSLSNYMIRLYRYAKKNRFDFIAINHRGCSGEPNKLFSSYHSGKTDDLDMVVSRYAADYENSYLVGYSLGGNVALKYAGEQGEKLPENIRNIIAVSTPVDLKGCATQMRKPKNKIYMDRFLKSLKAKAKLKMQQYSGHELNEHAIDQCSSFYDYDDLYTAPAHGFKDAEDYWAKSNSLQYLDQIKVPALLINALNDPFLSRSCYPVVLANNNSLLHLEVPKYGGHVGFVSKKKDWLERRIFNFIRQH